MKKPVRNLLCLLSVVLLASFTYSYFHVSGGEIDGVTDIGPDCTVTVRQPLAVYLTVVGEWTLTPEETDELRDLLLDSSFTRELSRVVSVDRTDQQYELRVSYPDGRSPLVITVLVGEFLYVADQFDGRHLKINDSDFMERLEGIFGASALASGAA